MLRHPFLVKVHLARRLPSRPLLKGEAVEVVMAVAAMARLEVEPVEMGMRCLSRTPYWCSSRTMISRCHRVWRFLTRICRQVGAEHSLGLTAP